MEAVLAKLEGRLTRGSRCLALHAGSNRLSTTLALMALTPTLAKSLVELHLPHNHVKIVTGLEILTNLQVLDLSHNCIARRGDLRALSLNMQLRTLYLDGNPLAMFLTAEKLQSAMFHLLPSLHALDGKTFSSPSSSLAPFKKMNGPAAPTRPHPTNSYLALHQRASNRSSGSNSNHECAHAGDPCVRQSGSNPYTVTYVHQRHLPPRAPPLDPAPPPPPSRPRLRYIPPWRRTPIPLPRGWGKFDVPASVVGYVSPSARIENALASATTASQSGGGEGRDYRKAGCLNYG